jgi:hypothetical protein
MDKRKLKSIIKKEVQSLLRENRPFSRPPPNRPETREQRGADHLKKPLESRVKGALGSLKMAVSSLRGYAQEWDKKALNSLADAIEETAETLKVEK